MGSMTAQAPPTWLEDLATADTSWLRRDGAYLTAARLVEAEDLHGG